MSRTALAELLRQTRIRPGRIPAASGFGFVELAGRLVELSGSGASATLTLLTRLILEAQALGEPAAWVGGGAIPYPLDLAESGVDLEALVLVHVDEPRLRLRAAERLLRSGAFGLVAVDLEAVPELPLAAQTRLLGLAQTHGSALVCLTLKREGAPSLGSLISLHARTERRRLLDGTYACAVRVVKDKRRGPGQTWTEVYRGPPGLR